MFKHIIGDRNQSKKRNKQKPKLMKKQVLFSAMCGLFLSNLSVAQNAIPNGNFENWSSATFETPQYYPFSSNPDAYFSQPPLPFNVTKTTDAQLGVYAAQLSTTGTSNDGGGFFANLNPDSDPFTWHGGIAYSQIPTGISGFYKYNASNDSGLVIVSFSKAGTNIGTYAFFLTGIKTTYTPFNFTFSPALPFAPDSIGFAFAASDLLNTNGVIGSTLLLDNLSLTGVGSQPANMNGDFELWQSQTVNKPNNWFFDNDGFNQTTDVMAGNFAMELTTYLGDNNGNPVARGAQISTGYWDNVCGCQKGGQPFTNQVDTLVFSYKYIPSGNDSAQISLNFKNNGTTVSGTGINLGASASYQTVSLPFNTFGVIDSVIFQAQSSKWQDSATSFVGSVLKIDEIHFKSQPLTTSILSYDEDNNIRIYPNPTNGKITVVGKDISLIEVYNIMGEIIQNTTNSKKQTINEINLSNQPKGIYFVRIKDGSKNYTRKIVVE